MGDGIFDTHLNHKGERILGLEPEGYELGTTRVVATAAGVMLMLAGYVAPLRAHHSTAMYDMSQRESIQGAIKTVEWINPHVWLWVMVITDSPERNTIVAFEADAPIVLTRWSGWGKDLLKPGDRVTVEYSPFRDGRSGGKVLRVVLADGRILTTGWDRQVK
jgi:hypothetical protein